MRAVREPASLPLIGSELTLARLRRGVRGSIRSFAARTPLGRHGEPLGAVHLVLSGLVSLTWTSNTGRNAILTLVGPGAAVGQDAALATGGRDNGSPAVIGSPPCYPWSLEPHQVDAEAFMASTTLALPAHELRGAFDRDPLIAVWLATSMGQRVRAMERSLIRSLLLPVRERVADVLREIASTHGERQSWGVIVRIPLSQDDIAAMVGATRESVNRALRHLEEAGEVYRIDGAYAVRGCCGDQSGDPGIS
jgi:CRP/FNR family transcriptional regulator, cyclic AMP receptor protein